MAILRAGPWAAPTDSFMDAPADFNTEPAQSPVNCASSDWANDTWKVLWAHFNPTFEDAGVAALGETVEMSGDNESDLFMEFHYQATVDFDIDVDWAETGFSGASFEWFVDTIDGYSDFGGGGGEGTGTEGITLPASTLGTMLFIISKSGAGTLSLTIQDA